jgi:hypothetical protein
MEVGTEVILLKDIYHDADDHSPFFYYGMKGDHAIIQPKVGSHWDYYLFINGVEHEVGVMADEIEEWVDNQNYTFLSDSKEGKCGAEGKQHKMKRWNCYHTSCINKGCDYYI